MGFNKDRRPSLDRGYRANVSASVSTGTKMRAGIYTIAAPAANSVWNLAALGTGEVVTIFADTSSTKDIAIQTASSATTFVGSGNDRLTLSTGQGNCVMAEFVGVSSSKVAFVVSSLSTSAKATLSSSTR